MRFSGVIKSSLVPPKHTKRLLEDTPADVFAIFLKSANLSASDNLNECHVGCQFN